MPKGGGGRSGSGDQTLRAQSQRSYLEDVLERFREALAGNLLIDDEQGFIGHGIEILVHR